MAPFYGWGSTASRLQPLQGGSLLFTIQFPEIPGTHFIDLGRMKGWVDLGATQWFWWFKLQTSSMRHHNWRRVLCTWKFFPQNDKIVSWCLHFILLTKNVLLIFKYKCHIMQSGLLFETWPYKFVSPLFMDSE